MAELKNYDVYLNGKGYMLARDNRGNLLSGAYAEKHSDPFMRYVSTEKRWAEVTFRFSDGAGAEKYDGSNRYRWGKNIDTRSGNLLRGPAATMFSTGFLGKRPVTGETVAGLELSNAATANEGLAVRFQAPVNRTLDTIAVLVKRKATRDYSGASNFTVGLFADAAGPVPGAVIGSQVHSFFEAGFDAARVYGVQPWENDEYFWVFAHIGQAVTAGTYYWVGIQNNQAFEVYWAGSTDDNTQTQAKWDGTNWAAHTNAGDFYHFIGWREYIDRPVTDLLSFRGSDGVNRIYAASGHKVMNKTDQATSFRLGGGPFGVPIRAMIVWDSKLYVGLGLNTDMQSCTGATASTVWATVTGERAIRFAVHDNLLWKVGGDSTLTGSHLLSAFDGSTWGADVGVGDPGTPVTAMVSHGGKLYCAKEEGIYEINYEDTYPASGSVTANLVLDFSTDAALRPWILDWHGGLYFPGNNAVYEWKNGVLRDIWNDRVDPDVQESTVTQQAEVPAYTTRKRNAPIATFPSTSRGVFHAAIGTARGLFVSVSSPHLYESQIWCFNLNGWHPMGPVRAKTGEDPLTASYLAEYISALHMRTLGPSEDRLYFAHGQAIGYFRLPGWTNDVSQYDQASYQAAWEVELPLFDADEPETLKYFHTLEIVSKNLGANPSIIVEYQVDTTPYGTAWTGSFELESTAAMGEIPLGFNGRNIRFRLYGRYGDSTTVPLIIEAATLKYHVLPDTVSTFGLMLDLSATMEKAGGGFDQRTAKTMMSDLRDLMEETRPWKFADFYSSARFVMALTLDFRPTILQERAGQMGPPFRAIANLTLLHIFDGYEFLTNGTFDANINWWDTAGGLLGALDWSGAEGSPDPGCLHVLTDLYGVGPQQGHVFSDPFSILAAATYHLKFCVKAGAGARPIEVRVVNAVTFATQSSTNVAVTEAWVEQEIELSLPAGQFRIAIYFLPKAIDPQPDYYLDSFSLLG